MEISFWDKQKRRKVGKPFWDGESINMHEEVKNRDQLHLDLQEVYHNTRNQAIENPVLITETKNKYFFKIGCKIMVRRYMTDACITYPSINQPPLEEN